MKKHCVNHKNKDVVDLANSLGIHPAIAASKIAIWQDKNGLDKFPTVDELSQTKEVNYQKNQTVSNEGLIASEKTIRDLAARMSDRIGMPVKFESDRSKEYKGKLENGAAVVNLAHATLDTPIHEILGHPIIRAIKGKYPLTSEYIQSEIDITKKLLNKEITKEEANKLREQRDNPTYSALYKNLLKELETGKGKEVLDRIKRDYVFKKEIPYMSSINAATFSGVKFTNDPSTSSTLLFDGAFLTKAL